MENNKKIPEYLIAIFLPCDYDADIKYNNPELFTFQDIDKMEEYINTREYDDSIFLISLIEPNPECVYYEDGEINYEDTNISWVNLSEREGMDVFDIKEAIKEWSE